MDKTACKVTWKKSQTQGTLRAMQRAQAAAAAKTISDKVQVPIGAAELAGVL